MSIEEIEKMYKSKGHASKAVKKGAEWWDKHRSEYGDKKLSWWVLEENKGFHSSSGEA